MRYRGANGQLAYRARAARAVFGMPAKGAGVPWIPRRIAVLAGKRRSRGNAGKLGDFTGHREISWSSGTRAVYTHACFYGIRMRGAANFAGYDSGKFRVIEMGVWRSVKRPDAGWKLNSGL